MRAAVKSLEEGMGSTYSGNWKNGGKETSNFKRAELTRRFLQQNSCQERRAGTQQPFNAPNLHCLPIQSCLNGENQADANGSGHADQSEDERHQRRRRKT